MWIGKTPFEEIGMTEDKVSLMEELAEDNVYWSNALSFMRSIQTRKLSSLTNRQRNWLYDIDAALGVELNKRIAREAFEDR